MTADSAASDHTGAMFAAHYAEIVDTKYLAPAPHCVDKPHALF